MTAPRNPKEQNPESTFLPFAEGRGLYNANIAMVFFKTFGHRETFDQGHVFLFPEREVSTTRYL